MEASTVREVSVEQPKLSYSVAEVSFRCCLGACLPALGRCRLQMAYRSAGFAVRPASELSAGGHLADHLGMSNDGGSLKAKSLL
jgi:hypothetical protein